jgi:uncharacterized protein (TIGR00251 family)
MAPGDAPRPFSTVGDGLRIAVRLTPKAARTRILGVVADADGGAVLRVAVTAAPEKGKANAALIALLARQWRIAKRDLAVVAGRTDRRKTIHLSGDPDRLAGMLEAWLATLSETD